MPTRWLVGDEEVIERCLLIGTTDEHDAARTKQRVFREPRGRIEIERLSASGEPADRAVAVGLGIERGGAARGMIPGLIFLFEDEHPRRI